MLPSLRSILFACSLTLLTITIGDNLRVNPAEKVASPYSYDIITWHIRNFPAKWAHRIVQWPVWMSVTSKDRRSIVTGYFNLTQSINELTDEISRASLEPVLGRNPILREPELERSVLNIERASRRTEVEEIVESAISDIAKDLKLGILGNLIFPPVDIRLTLPPKVLVTSRRDRIGRIHDVLIDPDIRVVEREFMESKLLDSFDLSAVVLDIGGIATYPASVHNGGDLNYTLGIAAHEWMHHYLFFRPLGLNMFKSKEMQILNETFAGMIGKEIGDLALYTLTTDLAIDDPNSAGRDYVEVETQIRDSTGFNFNHEMRETRKKVDILLASGEIHAAEHYMEERRKMFVDNGFKIRKLNQAFFAFNGTYADNPASISPIHEQLKRYRKATPDLGVFIKSVANHGNYQEFLDGLAGLEE